MTVNEAAFVEAIARMDAANAEDPRSETIEGVAVPRELAFARRTYAWVNQLVDQPSEALLLAARGHTLRRWKIPRDQYPKTTAGYHAWRRALARFHAAEALGILSDLGYEEPLLGRVRDLITKANWRTDAEGRALEDADCLAFLELKLHSYLDEWGQPKALDILKKTLAKMTPQAIKLARGLRLDPRSAALLTQATGE